jgi:hypothetical protein
MRIAVEYLCVRNDRPLIEQCEGCGAVVAVKLLPPWRNRQMQPEADYCPWFPNGTWELRLNIHHCLI